MRKSSFLHAFACTCFSFIHLLLTRIIPVFAIFLLGFLLHIFHSLRPLFAPTSPLSPSSSPFHDDGFLDQDLPLDAEQPYDTDQLPQGYSHDRLSTMREQLSARRREHGDQERHDTDVYNPSAPDFAPTANAYPTGSPASLEGVVAIKPRADLPSGRSKLRKLPPSLSMVKKAVRESSSKMWESQVSSSHRRGATSKNDSEGVVDRFRKHFMLDA